MTPPLISSRQNGSYKQALKEPSASKCQAKKHIKQKSYFHSFDNKTKTLRAIPVRIPPCWSGVAIQEKAELKANYLYAG